ncbi:hypothetical protein EVAR_38663_1 [Eumeta japonica]|uniref:Uncharacterized protein n=1 Tax=Eumeta variegata TaxID=151549 RepID=A0A4C1XXV3_EUMVA|nr:hypothetical protein EVAR_38663_1 [Eumeta japonica]
MIQNDLAITIKPQVTSGSDTVYLRSVIRASAAAAPPGGALGGGHTRGRRRGVAYAELEEDGRSGGDQRPRPDPLAQRGHLNTGALTWDMGYSNTLSKTHTLIEPIKCSYTLISALCAEIRVHFACAYPREGAGQPAPLEFASLGSAPAPRPAPLITVLRINYKADNQFFVASSFRFANRKNCLEHTRADGAGGAAHAPPSDLDDGTD